MADANGDTGRGRHRLLHRRSSGCQDESGRPTPDKVFFIDLSGGMELRLADISPEPLLEIRGKVTLEIGNELRDGNKFRVHARRLGHDQGLSSSATSPRAPRSSCSRSATASTTSSSGASPPFAANLEFLEQYGIYLQGSVLLQINTTAQTRSRDALARGHPGRPPGRRRRRRGAPALPTGTFAAGAARRGLDRRCSRHHGQRRPQRSTAQRRPARRGRTITYASGQRFQMQGLTRRDRPDRHERQDRGHRRRQEVAHQDHDRQHVLHREGADRCSERHAQGRLHRPQRGPHLRPRSRARWPSRSSAG